MSRYNYYRYFEPSRPIETDKGIKARSKKGAFAKSWWASRWITALEQLVDPGRLRRGRNYARRGQVLSIAESDAGVVATVQGSQRTPYRVTIEMKKLGDAQWEHIFDALGEQAIFSAQLLAGEMPQEIEEAFEAAGISLFPATRSALMTQCSCPDSANPCKHIAAVHYILGEQFDEDPFLLFRLRGRTQAQIMEALSARRAEGDSGEAEDEDEVEVVTRLEESVTHFWDVDPLLAELKLSIKPPITPYPVLKRLGQPGFLEEDILALLGSAYRAISQAAITTAFGEDPSPSDSN
jgi:uncharacterized Zn finger protein